MPAVALAAAFACVWPAAAPADQSVVSATIYPSSAGNISHVSVGLQALQACPEYAGPNPIYLYPPGQPFQLTQSTWLLSTVISCGLQVPIGDVNDVQVLNPSHGFQAPLSNADLTNPSLYQDPQAPGALPVISVDGTENQTTYIRPFRGGADANARDEVTETGAPITVVVYANGPPLIVHASARTLSSTAAATTAKLSARVATAAGSPVAPSALTWSWTFGDGATSSAASPTHRFAPGSYEVSVQVTQVAGGAGGTATIQFRTPAKPTSGHTNQSGGTKPTKSTSPTGTENGTHSKDHGGTKGSGGSGGAQSTTTSSQSTTTTVDDDLAVDDGGEHVHAIGDQHGLRRDPAAESAPAPQAAAEKGTRAAYARHRPGARRASGDRTPDQRRHHGAGGIQSARPPHGGRGGPAAASSGDQLAESRRARGGACVRPPAQPRGRVGAARAPSRAKRASGPLRAPVPASLTFS